MARCNVAMTSGFASPLKPMCVSLICTKAKSPRAGCPAAGCAAAAWPSVWDERSPPSRVQTSPVPAQAIQARAWRRVRPPAGGSSWMWSCGARMVSSVMLVSFRLLHDNRAFHMWVEGAEIGIGPCSAEAVREGVAGVQAGRGEQPLGRGHRVEVAVVIDPCDGGARADGDGRGPKHRLRHGDLGRRGRRRRGRRLWGRGGVLGGEGTRDAHEPREEDASGEGGAPPASLAAARAVDGGAMGARAPWMTG